MRLVRWGPPRRRQRRPRFAMRAPPASDCGRLGNAAQLARELARAGWAAPFAICRFFELATARDCAGVMGVSTHPWIVCCCLSCECVGGATFQPGRGGSGAAGLNI